MKDVKIISIDSNFYDPIHCQPVVSPFTIEFFNLKEGDIVLGYQDDQEWEGTIRYDSSSPEERQWYFEMNLDKEFTVSEERMKGRQEGAMSTFPTGEIRGELYVVTAMLEDGMGIDSVKKYTRLSKTRLHNLQYSIIGRRAVEEAINRWDPINLLSHAPKDEYSKEISCITQMLSFAKAPKKLAEVIYNEFQKKFGADVFKKEFDSCLIIAEEILKQIETMLININKKS